MNKAYSLRAFARSLGLEPSALSKILSGKRKITATTFKTLSRSLALTPEQVESFRPKKKSGDKNLSATNEIPPFQQLTLDLFQVISDWYHYAILELTETEGFVADPKVVARQLGITVAEVNIAVERLTRLEFLKITEDGRWIDESGKITTVGNEFTAAAFRNLQKQVLEKAINALEEVPLTERDQSSMTMAIHSDLLPEAKLRIRQFRRELNEFLKSKRPYNCVYNLGISLYPVSKP